MLRSMFLVPALLLSGCAVNSDYASEGEAYEVNAPVRAGAPGDVFLSSRSAGILGTTFSIDIGNAYAYEEVHLALSLDGDGDGLCYPGLGFLCMDINPPLKLLGSYWVDGDGEATLSFDVPDRPEHDGTEACFQAVIMRAGGSVVDKSNALCRTLDYDTDGDGLTDDEEEAAGSNPLIPDTDADGVLDS